MNYAGYPNCWGHHGHHHHHHHGEPYLVHPWVAWAGQPCAPEHAGHWQGGHWPGGHWHPGYHGPWYHEHHAYLLLPQEAYAAAGAPADVFVGGISECKLTLEYLPRGTGPTVTLVITSGGSTTTWSAPTPMDDYNIKSDFAPLQPGDRMELTANEAVARLRWCEVVER